MFLFIGRVGGAITGGAGDFSCLGALVGRTDGILGSALA